jgi:hypothetical protein
MLLAKLLPELASNYHREESILSSFHLLFWGSLTARGRFVDAPLLPHWPAWMVMISL